MSQRALTDDSTALEQQLGRIEAEIERLHALCELRHETIIERLRVLALAMSIREG